MAGVGFFALSVASAILVVRELIIYFPIDLAGVLFAPLGLLNGFAGLTRSLLNPAAIRRWDNLAVPIVIFAETGLFFGFFLPGDSLLFTTGLMASAGLVDLHLLVPLTILVAVAGDQVSYVIGRRSGTVLARRYRLLESDMQRARVFYERHGGKAIVIARFIPIVRTFAPAVAGAANMRYRRFVSYNIIGGVFWVLSVIFGGYFLGRVFPRIINDLYLLVSVIVVASIASFLVAWIRQVRRRLSRSEIKDKR